MISPSGWLSLKNYKKVEHENWLLKYSCLFAFKDYRAFDSNLYYFFHFLSPSSAATFDSLNIPWNPKLFSLLTFFYAYFKSNLLAYTKHKKFISSSICNIYIYLHHKHIQHNQLKSLVHEFWWASSVRVSVREWDGKSWKNVTL
jgi:hypothetical protein